MATAPRPKKTVDPGTDETIKETVEALVIAFILAFVFRAFVVEAFIIPTGSMAPTLLGKHVDTQCPSCGYRFNAGLRGGPGSGQPLGNNTEVACPMCRYPVQLLAGSRMQAGDRILVDKFIYSFTDPKRWDVVVFKNPQAYNDDGPPPSPGPRSNFIKRLVGLPGEQVFLLDGDVFVAPLGSNDFSIARKPDPDANPHWERIQRSMWQPVYHSQYVPLVTGVPGRGDGTIDQARDEDNAWDVPWFAVDGSEDVWNLGTALSPRRSYRFAGGTGRIVFGFRSTNLRQSRAGLGFPTYPYNRNLTGGFSNGLAGSSEPIEDIRLALSVMPTGGPFALTLSTTARLDLPGNGTETLSATLTDTGEITVTATDEDGNARQLGDTEKAAPLPAGVATEVELWVVDQQVSVWVRGEQVYRYDYGLSWEQVLARPEAWTLPDVSIALTADEPVELYRIELDRDVYYSTSWSDPARGGINRQRDGVVPGDLPGPITLRTRSADHDAELYVLGDNTADSEDGRKWRDVNGWVQRRYFGGETRTRVVPRSLLVGRAFFVYYPAPQPATHGGGGVVPDFGRMRFIHQDFASTRRTPYHAPLMSQPTLIMRHVIAALVTNEPGVLAQVAGMFAARGFNIDSLVVGRTENPELSRMTIVVIGDDAVLEQVRKQLQKLVPVVKVVDYQDVAFVERDLVMVQVNTKDGDNDTAHRSEIVQLAEIFRANIVDVAPDRVMIELGGTEEKLEAFVEMVKTFGIIELARTGVIAMPRGSATDPGRRPLRGGVRAYAPDEGDDDTIDPADLPPG